MDEQDPRGQVRNRIEGQTCNCFTYTCHDLVQNRKVLNADLEPNMDVATTISRGGTRVHAADCCLLPVVAP